jgi:hypothetical protein
MGKYRKGLIAAAGLLGQLVAAGMIPAPYDKWAAVVLAALTAAGVYAVPNAGTVAR